MIINMHQDFHPSQKQQLRILVVLALLQFTHIMDFMVLMPLGPQLMRLFSIDPQQFSFLVSIYTFSAAIAGLVGTMIFDRIDRKYALLGAYTGFLIGTIACAFAPSYTFLLIARAIAGAFGGVLSGVSFAIIGDVFSIEQRGFAVGRVMASFSLAAIVGVPIGLYFANLWGWHAPFVSVALMGLIVWLAVVVFIPNIRGHLSRQHPGLHPLEGIRWALNNDNARTALGLTFAIMLSQFIVIPFISPYITSNAAYPEADLPYLYFLGGLCTAFTGPLMGKISDRRGATKTFAKTGLLFLVPIFLITHLPPVPVWVVLMVSTSFFILSNARFIPAMTLISSSVPTARRGSFMSLNSSIQQLGSAFATVLGGFLVTQNADGSLAGFSHTAYFGACFGVLGYFLGRRIKMVS